MTAPRHINGIPLIRNGVPALADDCCCTPSCYPNICTTDPRALCCQYYCAAADDCRRINSFEINISGVLGSITCPSAVPDCCYAFDCECDLFNATFIHEHAANCSSLKRCISTWSLRPPYWTGVASSDTCNITPTLSCGSWTTSRSVYIETGFANEQTAFTSGFITNLILPNCHTSFGSWQICQDFTLRPGHYVVVILAHYLVVPLSAEGYTNEKMFIYEFANGVKRYTDCEDDNYYPVDNFIGGDAILFASRRSELTGALTPPNWTYDCDDWDYTCQLSQATVTVEPPDYELCEESEEPPPP